MQKLRTLLKTPIEDLTFSVVDTETTGMSAKFNKVMDIGIVKVKNGKIIEKWEALIDPKQRIDYWITKYTHISDKHVVGKPIYRHFAPKIDELLQGSIFVAHNIGFDYSFLKAEMVNADYLFDYPKLCTVQLGRKLLPHLANAHLDALSDYYNIEISARHRALPDAEATALILVEFIKIATANYNAKNFFDLYRLQRLKLNVSDRPFSTGLGTLFS